MSKFYNEMQEMIGELTSFDFSVLAPGTLAQLGELQSVTAKKPSFALGEKIPVEGIFKNTGTVPVKGTLVAELYKDGAYVDLVRGDELTVGIGETSAFSLVVQPKDAGTYTLTSYVKYANKRTESIDLSFAVTGGGVFSALNSAIGIGVLSVAVLLGALIVAIRRRRRRAVPEVPAPTILDEPEVSASPPDDPNRRW